MEQVKGGITRRNILTLVGTAVGAGAMYGAMTKMGFAKPSNYKGKLQLSGDPKGASVVVLGAGLAGMTAAYELREAGYKVTVLEYQNRAGGRCISFRKGTVVEEMGGETQVCDFEEGNYINPGPWRIPSDHYALLDYCKRFGVQMEPFMQVNFNAYLHKKNAFDGKPKRFKEIEADYRGQISELLAKAVNQKALDDEITEAEAEILLNSLRSYGRLNTDFAYVEGDRTSSYRGYKKDAGGGVGARPEPSAIIELTEILNAGMFDQLITGSSIDHQSAIFQPVGGMDQIAEGFKRQVGDLITYNAKVTAIRNKEDGVEVTWVPAKGEGAETVVKADYCICTIPFSVLGQLDHDFSEEMSEIISSMYYASSFKIGLEFKRRFWEQDEHIYGGISYTDLPISQISYPSTNYFSDGPGVLMGAYCWGASSYQFNSIPHAERERICVEYGSQIHPQMKAELKSSVSMAWHRQSWILGCYGIWKDKEAQYDNACKMDGRTLMAGEHISYLPAWQEGAILSAINATERLHKHVVGE